LNVYYAEQFYRCTANIYITQCMLGSVDTNNNIDVLPSDLN